MFFSRLAGKLNNGINDRHRKEAEEKGSKSSQGPRRINIICKKIFEFSFRPDRKSADSGRSSGKALK